MNIRRLSAYAFIVLAVVIITFQVALAVGAPWGAYAMSGAFPGQLPMELRVAAVIQALLWGAFACVIGARAGLGIESLARASRWMAWVIVAITALSVILNLISPSAGERMLWAPVALALLVCSALVATGRAPKT